ncbi:MAG TPA: sigma 54-interacting transcriptional regulator [Myxococcales bacterium]|nr:sigma 54-interacting transcriptional regulator [Myxococcales bacterium]
MTRIEPAPDAAPALRLVVSDGPDVGKEIPLKGSVFIGTHQDCQLQLSDNTVSRYHLEIQVRPDGIFVKDQGSRNGTRLGQAKVDSFTAKVGTKFRVGRTELVIASQSQDGQAVAPTKFGRALGISQPMRDLFGALTRVAKTDSTVLLLGETGTGKEVLAEGVHQSSRRAKKPFVVVDCASVAPNLIESELFGHVKGSYTGATSDRDGAFALADGGTIFLDEVGELPLELQPRLLRILETGVIKRVGDTQERKVNVRVVAATHRNLEQEVKNGNFRLDLFYRLGVVMVNVPPLRDRLDDLELLCNHFARTLGRPDFELPADVLETLRKHIWPGNVRELRNLVERAVAGAEPELTPTPIRRTSSNAKMVPLGERQATRELADLPFKEAKEKLLGSFVREYFAEILKRADGNLSRAARLAGIARPHLHEIVNKHGLRSVDGEPAEPAA